MQHSNKVFRFDRQWATLQTLESDRFEPRASHCGFVAEDCFYLYGGQLESTATIYSKWLRLDLNDLSWTEFLDPPLPGRYGATCVSHAGRAVVFGGATAEGPTSEVLVLDKGKR